MKNNFKLLGLLVAVLFASCSQNRYLVAPPFTDVDKIASLKKGMSLSDVNKTLGISPFDMFVSDEGYAIFTYNYRLKERRIPIDNNETFMDRPGDPAAKSVNSEEAQQFGTDYYTWEKKMYLSFKDEKLVSVISPEGLQHASKIIAITGSLSALRNDPQFKVLPDALLHNNVVIPLDDKGNYIQNNQGVGGSGAPGFIYLGNTPGISTIPATEPREIKENRIIKKSRNNMILKNLNKKNKGLEPNYESDY